MTAVSHRKPCAGNTYARFGDGVSALEKPRQKAILHNAINKTIKVMVLFIDALVSACALADTEVVDGVEWTYEISGGYAVVGSASGYANAIDNGFVGEVVVPSRLGGYEVRRIGKYAFARCRNITSFKIPETVRELDGFAFASSNVLKRIEIPRCVEKISGNPFASLFSLEEIVVSNGNANFKATDGILYDVNAKTLVACPCSKANVVIPEGVKEIGKYAFYGNFEVTSVVLPNSVETISDSAFESCMELNELTISRGLKHIGESAFKECDKLTSDINLPEGVTNIGACAFAGCSWLPSATLPDSLRALGTEAFRDCGKLVDLKIGNGIPNLPNDVFRSCESLGSIDIPSSVKTIGDNAFNSAGVTSVVFCAGTETIGDYAFFACSSIEIVELPETLRVIGCCAFKRCSGLRACFLPEGVGTIGDEAFAKCQRIEALQIPSTVTQIGGGAFSGCSGLSSVFYNGKQPEYVADNVYSGAPATLVSYVGLSDPSWTTDLARKVWRDRAITTPGGDVIHYTVTLDATGGDVETASLLFQRGVMVGDIPKPVKSGFVFVGWFTEPDGGTAISPSLEVTDDMHLYAHWTRSSNERLYMVVHLDAGSAATTYPVTYLSDVPDGGWSDEYKTTKLVLRRIEPGTFKMSGKCNVSLSIPYYIGVFEVTRKQWQLIKGEYPKYSVASRDTSAAAWEYLLDVKGCPRYVGDPVEVSTNSIIGLLRSKTNLRFDLPTEAQWEYACRAGTESLYNNGGDSEADMKELGFFNLGGNGYSVGAYAPNAFGLYDMHGSAWEVCLDFFGLLTVSEGTLDPVGAEKSDMWVLRGGSHNSKPEDCTSLSRIGTHANACWLRWNYYSDVGMRVCLPLPIEAMDVFDVTFDFNYDGRECVVQKRMSGTVLGELPLPQREGYEFVGWKVAGGSVYATAKDVIFRNVRYIAEWSKSSITNSSEESRRYLIIDLSSGPDSAVYPFTYCSSPPPLGWTDDYKTDKIVLRRIEPGAFTMGDIVHDSKSLNMGMCNVTLSKPYYVGVFEVTQRQWELVMGGRPSRCSSAEYYATRPVEWILWSEIRGDSNAVDWPDSNRVDADSFMGKLRTRTGLALDLPTEAQWEYACRAGTSSDFNNGVTLGGDSWTKVLMQEINVPGRHAYNVVGDKLGGLSPVNNQSSMRCHACTTNECTSPVGSYPPNAWGLYDMHGNAAEWCLDWYKTDKKLYDGQTDPVGPTSGSSHTVRGGSYAEDPHHCTSFARTLAYGERTPGATGFYTGLRVCLAIATSPPSGTCTVTFNAAGGTCSESSRYVARGSKIGELPSVSRSGYDFMGWKCDKEIISSDYVVNGDRTCYAQWRQKGLVVKAGSCKSAAVALAYATSEKSASAKLDYEYLESSYEYYDFADNSDEMCVYYYKIGLKKGQGFAAWIDGDESGELELSAYRLNGANTPTIYSYLDSNCYRVMPYNWSDSHDDSAIYYIEIAGHLNEPFTLHYIGFNKTSSTMYTVKYDANGGVYDMEEDDVLYGDGFRLPSCDFEKPGYEFAGWAKSRTGVVVYQDEEYVRNLTASGKSITLYAIWAKEGSTPAPKNVYTVRFNANGGEGSMEDQTFTIGKEQSLAKNAFSVSGRTFLGWTTKPSGQVQIPDLYMDGDTVADLTDKGGSVVNLYAVWGNPSHGTTVRLRKTADDEYVWTTSVTVSRGESHLFWIEGIDGDDDCCLDVVARNDESLQASEWWEFENSHGGYGLYAFLTEDDWKWSDTSASSVSFCVTVSAWDACPNSTLKFGHMSGNMPVELTWRVTFDPGEGDLNWNGAIPVGYAKTVEYKNNAALGALEVPTRNGYKFLGWFTSETGGTKVTASTKVTNDVTYYAHWECDGTAMVSVAVAEGCESMGGVTGGNAMFKAGTKVSLKATANNGCVFVGWRLINGESTGSSTSPYLSQSVSFSYVAMGEPVEIAAVFATMSDDAGSLKVNVADGATEADGTFELDVGACVTSLSQPKITVSGLPTGIKFAAKTGVISGKATKPGVYKVTVSATNATVKKPVTAEFEIVVPNLSSEKLPGLEQDTDAYGVVMCGVALDPGLVNCTPEEGWAVKVAGLPAGLKFTAKDIMKKGSKTEVDISANTIYGVPTAKPGAYTVTFTATKGKENQTATITLNVEPLPTWAVGTFAGYVVGDDWSRGFATMTVAANGKVSGKIALEGINWTFSATSFSRVEHVERVEGGVATNFVVEAVAKAGKVTRDLTLTVGGHAGRVTLLNAVAEGTFGDGEVKMWRGMWKDKATAAEAKATIEKFMGVYTVSVADGTDYGCGYLSLTVGKDGTTRATGKLADGMSVSASSPLMYDEEAGWLVMLYAAPSAYKGGCFTAAVGFEDQLAPVLFTPVWSSRDPQATGDYGEGFDREVNLVGAYYSKLDTLRKYYESVRLDLGGTPELGFTFKETSLNEQGKKVTTSSTATAEAVDTLLQPGLTATVDEKGAIVVAKATKPVQDKATKEWFYNGTNDGAMTLSFAQATGIFKGSYTFWYDYVSAYDETKAKDNETRAHASKKVSFEGILVQGEEPKMDGFYLWDATGEYEDPKTGKAKSYKYKQSFPVRLFAE